MISLKQRQCRLQLKFFNSICLCKYFVLYLCICRDKRCYLNILVYFSLYYAAAMISVRPFTGRLYDSKGPSAGHLSVIDSFCSRIILLSNMNSVLTLLISGVLIGIGYGSLFPCFQALAIQSAQKHRSGHATSTFFHLI